MRHCKACGLLVTWKKTAGKWFCFNADGSDHWDLCSKRRWEQVKLTGVRFDTDTEWAGGYKNSIRGTKLDRIDCPPIDGTQYVPSQCNCGVPPWENCTPECKSHRTKRPAM